MEKLLSLRGILFGALGGLLAFVLMKLMAEPIIGRAIDYESGRDEAEAGLAHGAAGHSMGGMDMGGMDMGGDTELFSRGVQSTIGAGVGMVAFGIAMGAIAAVVLGLWLHRRGTAAGATRLVLPVVAMVFGAAYLLPTLKYPANPPSVGNPDTIQARTGLFLAMVAISAIALAAAVVIRRRLRPRMGARSTWIAAAVVAVVFLVAWAALPSLGDLAANSELGSSSETPGPVTGPDGMIVYPGFPADDLYAFRLYSLLAQVVLWMVIALGLRGAVSRIDPEAVAVSETQSRRRPVAATA